MTTAPLPDFGRLDPDLISFLEEHFGSPETCHSDIALSSPLQQRRGISRQAAAALLNRLVSQDILAEGAGLRPKTYKLNCPTVFVKTYKLDGLEEHLVWSNDLLPILSKYAQPNALRIWEFGVTEMINNAIDHSQGTEVVVALRLSPIDARCLIRDDGEGVFRRIKRLCNLVDERQAIIELSKGKLTTDPSRHSGEGIFFTSRAMDWFSLDSHDLSFSHIESDGDRNWLFEINEDIQGTRIMMDLCHRTSHVLRNIFDQFADPDSYSFNRTIVPVRLAKIGAESLVSRSQAARLLARVDKFEHVIFDFTGIDSIGQAFADEIFRVFAADHPEVEITSSHTSDEVQSMINRARSHRP